MVSVLLNFRMICKVLPDEQLSLYVVAAGATSLGTLIAGAGLATVMLRRFSPKKADEQQVEDRAGLLKKILTIASVTWAVTAFSLFAVLYVRPNLLGRSMTTVIIWILLWMAARCAITLLTEAFRGIQRFSMAAAFGGLQEGPLVNISMFVLLYAFGSHLAEASSVMMLHVLTTTVISGVGLVLVTRSLKRVVVSPATGGHSLPTTKSLLSESMKVLVSQMAIFGLVEFETLLVGRYCSDVQIGAWGAVRRLIAVVSAPLLLINAAIPTFVAELHQSGERSRLERLLRTASSVATPPAVIAFTAILLFGKTILTSFDPAFESASTCFAMLAAANIIFVAAGSAGLTLRMTNHQGWATASTLVLAGVYVLIAPWVIQHYSLFGAAVLAAAMIVLRNVIATLLVRRFLNIWCIPSFNAKEIREFIKMLKNRRRRSVGSPGAD